MAITDFNAAQKWAKIPKNTQRLITNNVFCFTCGVTRIIEYTINDGKLGILLKGKCNKCGKEVVRFIEDV